MLGGSSDLVNKVISTLIGVISIVTLFRTLVTKSHDHLSRISGSFCLGSAVSVGLVHIGALIIGQRSVPERLRPVGSRLGPSVAI